MCNIEKRLLVLFSLLFLEIPNFLPILILLSITECFINNFNRFRRAIEGVLLTKAYYTMGEYFMIKLSASTWYNFFGNKMILTTVYTFAVSESVYEKFDQNVKHIFKKRL